MNSMLRSALYALTSHYKASADQMEKTIIGFGLFASLASAAAGAVTGVGPLAATAITTACVYAMYFKLAKIIDIEISKNILKSIASAVLANLVSNVGVTLVVSFAISFIPVFGNLSSAAICAITQFASVYVSGYIFTSTLNALHEKFGSLNAITKDSFLNTAKDVSENTDMKKVVKEAHQVHKEVKDNDEYKDLSEFEQLVNEAKANL